MSFFRTNGILNASKGFFGGVVVGGGGGGGIGDLPVTSNLRLWLKADAGVTTSGSNVTAWLDQSPNARNFVPDTQTPDITLAPSVAGFNNKPAVRFGTTNNFGNIGLYHDSVFTGKTVFMVYILESVSGSEYSVIYENSGINLYTSYGNGNGTYGGYFNGFYDSNTTSSLNIPYLRTCLTEDGNGIQYFLNGAADGTQTGSGFYSRTQTVIGNGGARFGRPGGFINQPFQGYIAEIVAYDRVLTTQERQQVEAYLNAKYAIY